MTPRAFAPLLPALLFAVLSACAPKEASKPAQAPESSPVAAPDAASEAATRTHDELGAGREIAPAEPTPEPEADSKAAELETKERDLARRERDLSAREAKVARAIQPKPAPKPARAEAPAPAPAEVAVTTAPESVESSANDSIAEGSEPAEEALGGYDVEPAEEAEPEPAPALTVPLGQHLAVELVAGLSSAESQAGDTFRVRVARDVEADGELAIPAGSEVHGLVSEAVSAGAKRGQPAKLVLKFTDLVLPDGTTLPIRATLEEIGESRPGRKAATVGGGAAAGAVLGRVLAGSGSRGKGTVIGALVGALAGAAIASHTAASEQIEIPAGTLFNLRLDEAVEIGGGGRYSVEPPGR